MRIFTDTELPQKTRRWFEMRRGRVCSSDVADFVDSDGCLKRGRSTTQPIGQAVRTYVAKLVAERVTGHMDISDFASQAMQYGAEHEAAARAALSLATDLDFEPVGGFLSGCGRWWSSSDGAAFYGDTEAVVAVAETKIPLPKTQVAYLLDEQKLIDDYKPQLCHEILVSGAACGYLFSYGAGFQCRRANVLVTINGDDPFIANLRASLETIDGMVNEAMDRIGGSGGLADPPQTAEAWFEEVFGT